MKSVEGNLAPETYNTYTNNNDKAKQTIRQTTQQAKYVSNVNPDYYVMNLDNPDKQE